MSGTPDRDLDRRIRDLVADAVADAPAPPDAATFAQTSERTNGRRAGRWRLFAAIGAAAAAAAVVGFVVIPGLGDEAIRDVDPADTPTTTVDPEPMRDPDPTAPPITAPPADTAPPTTGVTDEPAPGMAAATALQVRPFGIQGDDPSLGVMVLDVDSVPGAGAPGDVVLRYELELGFDHAGRTGSLVAPSATTDGQLAIEVECLAEACFDLAPVNDFRQTSIAVTARRTAATLEPGAHHAPFELVFDDGTIEVFDLVLWGEPEPSADISTAVTASTGLPQRVQTVFTGGAFAYHAIAAFDSIWVLNTSSGTVSRIDEFSGELLATIPIREPSAGGGGITRLTATDDAVFVTATPAMRIDPDTDEASEITDDVGAAVMIAGGDTVWAAGIGGPIVRIDADETLTEVGPAGRWVDLAISNGLVWAVDQARGGVRLVAFDGITGEIHHDTVVAVGVDGFAVRMVADETDVVVGVDTSGGGGRTGQLLVIDPDTGAVTDTVTLDSRPEGIVLTPHRIWTSGAVLDRDTLQVRHTDGFGFTITRGSDGSIWGTGGVPGSHTGEAVVYRYAPGDLAG